MSFPSGFRLIAGPCVIESREMALRHAECLTTLLGEQAFIFKASYDKANRQSIHSFRGVGIERGLAILAEIKEQFGLRLTTDVHNPAEVLMAAEVVDILQIPAFLCRQTDLLTAAGLTGKPVHIKKGQFATAQTMVLAAEKVQITGNADVHIIERGSCFGRGQLVVDFTQIVQMHQAGLSVIFDATHSLQGQDTDPSYAVSLFAESLARAALAVGVSGLFFETHLSPTHARSDVATQIPLDAFGAMIGRLYGYRE